MLTDSWFNDPLKSHGRRGWFSGANPSWRYSIVCSILTLPIFILHPSPSRAYIRPKVFLFSFFPPFRSWIAVRSLASTQSGESSSYRKRVKATRRHQLSNISTTSCAAADNSLSARWSAKSAREGGYDTRFRRHLNPCELPIPRDGRGSLARGIARFQPPRVSRLVRRHASVKTGGLLLLLHGWNWNWNEWLSVCVCARARTRQKLRAKSNCVTAALRSNESESRVV